MLDIWFWGLHAYTTVLKVCCRAWETGIALDYIIVHVFCSYQVTYFGKICMKFWGFLQRDVLSCSFDKNSKVNERQPVSPARMIIDTS